MRTLLHASLIILGTIFPITQANAKWRSVLYPEKGYNPSSANLDTDKVLEDFSYAGYRSGYSPLPDVTSPVFKVTDAPYNADSTGQIDATLAIQAALDDAEKLGGGVVFLPAGTYRLSVAAAKNQALLIHSSHVILRGAGIGQTFLFNSTFSGMRYKSVIRIQGPVESRFQADGPSVPLSRDMLHSTTLIPVLSTKDFAVGDTVVVRNDITNAWITEHGELSWFGHGETLGGLTYRRSVLKIDSAANTLAVESPIRYSLKLRDNARVVRLTASPLNETGLEDFSVGNLQNPGTTWAEDDNSIPRTPGYEISSAFFIACQRSCNCWIRRIASYQPRENTSTAHLLSGGILIEDSTHITVEHCTFQRPQYGGGGGNGYMFALRDSAECLIQECEARYARHGFQFGGIGTSGNVIHDCLDAETGRATGASGYYATGGQASDSHNYFSQANLVDACTAEDSRFEARYRGSFGTKLKHGLTATHTVFWNIQGTGGKKNDAVVLSEQAGYGYVIGTRGPRSLVILKNDFPAGTSPLDHLEGEGLGETLEPFSLFLDQCKHRLGSSPTPPAK